MRNTIKKIVTATTLGVVMVVTPLLVWADAEDRYAKQIEVFLAEIKSQSEAQQASAVSAELGELRTWVDEAKKLLKEGETEQAGYRLKRVEYGLDLVRALIAAEQIEATAKNQTEGFSDVGQQTIKLKEEVQQLKNKKIQLEQELNLLNKGGRR